MWHKTNYVVFATINLNTSFAAFVFYDVLFGESTEQQLFYLSVNIPQYDNTLKHTDDDERKEAE